MDEIPNDLYAKGLDAARLRLKADNPTMTDEEIEAILNGEEIDKAWLKKPND